MLMRTSPPRKAGPAPHMQVAKDGIVQAPVGGWDAVSALADMPGDRAVSLVNWFPKPGYVEIRRGHQYHAWDLKSTTTPVETLMVWQGQASSGKMFGIAGDTIYDVTTRGQATATTVTSLTDSYWQWVNFTNTATTYLYLVGEGNNAPYHYNGTTWTQPTITGVTPADIVNINVHKKRLWFCLRNSTQAAYLATDAISGAATTFELGSVFSDGGYLMAMATWTRDGGSGADDFAVFISSRGQVAIYQGTDPSSANTWALVGVFETPAPIGRRCFRRFGADVLLITVEGVFPLSQILSVDVSSQRRVAVTENITNAMTTAARTYGTNQGWEMCVYRKGTQLILNVPTAEFSMAEQYVMNTLTGAWCRFTGMDANAWVVFNDDLYFSGNDGAVYQADVGSADVATPIQATGETAYTAFRSAKSKRFTALQALVSASSVNRPSLGLSVDFESTATVSTPSVVEVGGSGVWDVSDWDVGVWSATTQQYNDWVSIPAVGKFASVKFQASIGTSTESGNEAYWGLAVWGDNWTDNVFSSDEVVRINGFVLNYELGEYY